MKVLSYAPEKVAKIVNLDVENAEAVEAFVGKKPIVLDLAHGLKLFYSDNYKRAWNKKVFVSQYNDGVVESRCMSIHSPYFIAQTDGNNYCNIEDDIVKCLIPMFGFPHGEEWAGN